MVLNTKQTVTIDWLEMRFTNKSPFETNVNEKIYISKNLKLAPIFQKTEYNVVANYLAHYDLIYDGCIVGCLNAPGPGSLEFATQE